MEITNLRKRINKIKYDTDALKGIFDDKMDTLDVLNLKLSNMASARKLLLKYLSGIQDEFACNIEALVTKGINIIFKDRDFIFKLYFDEKRNNIETRPVIIEDGIEYDPKEDLGGSILPVIGFIVKIVLISLEKPDKMRFIAMDEPFNWVGKYKENIGAMVREICNKLKFQLLFVTHDTELSKIADKVYNVTHNKKDGSKLQEIK